MPDVAPVTTHTLPRISQVVDMSSCVRAGGDTLQRGRADGTCRRGCTGARFRPMVRAMKQCTGFDELSRAHLLRAALETMHVGHLFDRALMPQVFFATQSFEALN